MKRSLIFVLTLALTALVFASACSKSTNSTNSTNTTNAGKTTSGTTAAAMSPTEVFNAYYDSSMKKDYATAKKYLSQGTLRLMEEEAKKQGKTLDEALKESAPTSPDQTEKPKLGNEKISGDTATVDITAEGRTVPMPFVKEGGEWKIAMDKLLEGMMNDLKNSVPKDSGEPGAGKSDSDNDNDNH